MSRLIVAGKGPAWELIAAMSGGIPVESGTPLIPGDVLLSVQYDRIVTAAQLAGYSLALNVHFGPLPELRGCFPTKWAIINGEPYGVTLHHMVSGVDAGPVLEVVRVCSDGLTDGEVYADCNRIAVGIVRRWLPRILSGNVPDGDPQDEAKAKYYPRKVPYDGRMPVDATPELADRLRRAFTHPPYPGVEE